MTDDNKPEIVGVDENSRIKLVFLPGATGPLPSHIRWEKLPGQPPRVVTEDIPQIRIVVNGVERVWSRNQVARDTGLSMTTISKLFTGSRKPSLRTAKALSTYFGVTIERLLLEVLPRWEMKVVRKSHPTTNLPR